jgi:hypothetical protein
MRSVLLLSVMTVAALGAQPAMAAPVDLVCPFAGTASFSPGVTLTSKAVSLSGSTAYGTGLSPLTPCSSVVSGVSYTGGTGQVSGSGTLACVVLGNGLSGAVSGTILQNWSNGDTSTISFSVVPVGPVPVFLANVTGGALQGATVTVIPGPTGLSGNCLLSPVTSLSFGGFIVFSRL